MDAEEILNVVHEVSVALEEASDAQAKADGAIRLASSDIAAAEKHLTQVQRTALPNLAFSRSESKGKLWWFFPCVKT